MQFGETMILKQCCDALEQNLLTIAFIESASSGYLSSQFSIYKRSGADILLGGLVSYDPSIKISILKIKSLSDNCDNYRRFICVHWDLKRKTFGASSEILQEPMDPFSFINELRHCCNLRFLFCL